MYHLATRVKQTVNPQYTHKSASRHGVQSSRRSCFVWDSGMQSFSSTLIFVPSDACPNPSFPYLPRVCLYPPPSRVHNTRLILILKIQHHTECCLCRFITCARPSVSRTLSFTRVSSPTTPMISSHMKEPYITAIRLLTMNLHLSLP
jgi:hypothetical protein